MRPSFDSRAMRLVAGLALLGSLAASCGNGTGSSDGASGADAGGVSATVRDFEIALSSATVERGDVAFSIENEGPSTHEFVVVKSDAAPDQLPVENGLVSEDGVDLIGEAEDIAPSTTTDLTLNLQPGSYIIMCNIAGHYEQGMHTGFTVG